MKKTKQQNSDQRGKKAQAYTVIMLSANKNELKRTF